ELAGDGELLAHGAARSRDGLQRGVRAARPEHQHEDHQPEGDRGGVDLHGPSPASPPSTSPPSAPKPPSGSPATPPSAPIATPSVRSLQFLVGSNEARSTKSESWNVTTPDRGTFAMWLAYSTVAHARFTEARFVGLSSLVSTMS